MAHDDQDTRTQEERAQDDLEERWEATGKPTGEFRPRRRPSTKTLGAWELVCVDGGGRTIPGVMPRRFRPAEDEICTVQLLSEAATEAHA